MPSFSNLHPSTLTPLLQTPPTPGGSLTNLPMGSTGVNQQQHATPTTPPIPGSPAGQATPSTPAASVKQPSKRLRLSVSYTVFMQCVNMKVCSIRIVLRDVNLMPNG